MKNSFVSSGRWLYLRVNPVLTSKPLVCCALQFFNSSQNGSPVAATEAGTVIATVCKKRRGNESASVEINIGEGQYISLNDPDGVSGLDRQMKQTAASQLKVLQDQMASLMAQLQQ